MRMFEPSTRYPYTKAVSHVFNRSPEEKFEIVPLNRSDRFLPYISLFYIRVMSLKIGITFLHLSSTNSMFLDTGDVATYAD